MPSSHSPIADVIPSAVIEISRAHIQRWSTLPSWSGPC